MNRLLLIPLFCLVSFVAFCDNGIQITFLSIVDHKPLENVQVFCFAGDSTVISNSAGEVFLGKPKTDSICIGYYLEGYKQGKTTLNIKHKQYFTIYLETLDYQLNAVTVADSRNNTMEVLQLNAVEDMAIFSAKKTENIRIDDLAANISTNNGRQVYARVPGLNIWESSGSGLNTEIGGRGLSPQRSSNFNVRQNGYDISADALGYPDAYYVPPIEAVDNIEVVHGAASLQYGTQFGGMVNYRLKGPDKSNIYNIEARVSGGSFGFFNGFTEASVSLKNVHFYNAFQYKRGNGWRENSQFHSYFNFSKVVIDATDKFTISAEYTYFSYLAQQAGGLTDALFAHDPRQSIRDRNWFNVNWHLPELELEYKFNNRTKLQSKTFALFANRGAVGFLGNITRVDLIEDRDLLKDKYKNIGNETRLLHKYYFGKNPQVFLAGARFYKGYTTKKQGNTDAGYGPSFYYLHPDRLEGSDYEFPSRNIAIFAENIFYITKHLSITPGIRFENIVTRSEGYYHSLSTDLAGNILLDTLYQDASTQKRSFVIMGIGASYKPNRSFELYANISQNYRAVNFNDLRIVNPNFRVDPNLQDERGFNGDLGIRGVVKEMVAYDISVFYLKYNNRIGFVLRSDSVLFNTYRYRTNVSESRSVGIESVIDVNWLAHLQQPKNPYYLKTFVSFSYTDGRYVNSKEQAFDGKLVELVPRYTLKTGITIGYKSFKLAYQFSYTGQHFTDASNAEFSPDAVNGIIPAYYTMDLSASYKYKFMMFELNINNLSNNMYFTRRAAGYPGPGIIPADGIGIYATVGFQLSKAKN